MLQKVKVQKIRGSGRLRHKWSIDITIHTKDPGTTGEEGGKRLQERKIKEEKREMVSSEQDLVIVLRNSFKCGSLHKACQISILTVLEAFIKPHSYLRSHGLQRKNNWFSLREWFQLGAQCFSGWADSHGQHKLESMDLKR